MILHLAVVSVFRRYEEDMYWRRMEEEQHHWDERRRLPDGGYPQGPPGLLGVRPGMPGLQPQGPVVRLFICLCSAAQCIARQDCNAESKFEKCQNILIQLFSFSPHVVLILQMTVTSWPSMQPSIRQKTSSSLSRRSCQSQNGPSNWSRTSLQIRTSLKKRTKRRRNLLKTGVVFEMLLSVWLNAVKLEWFSTWLSGNQVYLFFCYRLEPWREWWGSESWPKACFFAGTRTSTSSCSALRSPPRTSSPALWSTSPNN